MSTGREAPGNCSNPIKAVFSPDYLCWDSPKQTAQREGWDPCALEAPGSGGRLPAEGTCLSVCFTESTVNPSGHFQGDSCEVCTGPFRVSCAVPTWDLLPAASAPAGLSRHPSPPTLAHKPLEHPPPPPRPVLPPWTGAFTTSSPTFACHPAADRLGGSNRLNSLTSAPQSQPRALWGARRSRRETCIPSPRARALWNPRRRCSRSAPAACGAVVPSGQGQRLHLGTHGPSPPPTARRRWLPQGGIPESETPQPPPPPRLPGRRAGRSEGGEFGKLVNRKAQPPLLPLPRAAAARSRRQGLRLAAGDHGQVAAKWAAPRKNLEDARGGTSARAPGLSPLSARPRSRLPAPNPEAPRALRLNAEALRARLPPSAALHLLPRATGAPGCCPRTWLNLTFQTVQVSAAEQHSATPSAGSPRPGRGEDLPSTALLAPAFPGRAPWLAASRGALRGRRALGVAGLGKVAKLSGQRFVRNQRGLFLKCPTPSL